MQPRVESLAGGRNPWFAARVANPSPFQGEGRE